MNTSELNNLIKLAKFAGGRFDLVQAGGGNVSWKMPNGEILIKISGISMSEISSEQQCARLITQQVLDILNHDALLSISSKAERENKAKQLLADANLTPAKRPSIETFLHIMLHQYTLHTHPIAVNHLVIRKDAKEIVQTLFPNSIFVDYATPGIDLAIKFKEQIAQYVAKHHKEPNIVFLKNHGLLISAHNACEVQKLTQTVVTTIEEALGLDYQRYHLATYIAALFNNILDYHCVAYLSEDQLIQQIWQANPSLMNIWPTSPDAFVFNGIVPCELAQLNPQELHEYEEKYGFYPKVIIYQKYLFFINQTIRKAKEMEEVFKFHLMAVHHAQGEIETLPRDELLYLAGWEAEKYRQLC